MRTRLSDLQKSETLLRDSDGRVLRAFVELRGTFQFEQPSWVDDLTLAQQSALEPPYLYNRVVVENDLSVTPRPQNASFGRLHEKVVTEQTG